MSILINIYIQTYLARSFNFNRVVVAYGLKQINCCCQLLFIIGRVI